MPMYRRRSRRPRRKMGNSVIHVPSSMDATLVANTAVVLVLTSPSIFAGGSASSNIEAQDKDRAVNVGHHVGAFTVDISVRDTPASGIIECCVFKVERAATTPILGTHPIPSTAEVLTQGTQQACRLANPGKVFHYSKRAFSDNQIIAHRFRVSPAKFRLSKLKAGDHWILLLFNRGTGSITFDFEARYKEYE